MSIEYVLLLFAIGAVTGFINVMAGGGSALAMPMLIFLGLDSAMANGTTRIALVLQNISAVSSFNQEKAYPFKMGSKMALWTFPGAIIGAVLAVKIDDLWFQRILAFVLIGIILSMIFAPKAKTLADAVAADTITNRWIYPAMFVIGFYGGFIQAGVGFIIMAALFHILNLNLVRINMHKVFIVLLYTIPALGIFIYNGKVHWGYGLSMAAGNMVGAWWSAKFSVKKGDRFVKYVLYVAIILVILKLLKVF